MSKGKNTTKKQAKPEEHLYALDELIRNCEAITGHKKEVAQGALFDCKKEKITKAEFETKVKTFLKKGVK